MPPSGHEFCEFRVRLAKPADLPALNAIERECFGPGVAISPRQMRYLLGRPTTFIAVAETRGGVAGDAIVLYRSTAGGLVARIYSMAVGKAYRGGGAGGRLLKYCLAAVRAANARAAVLEVQADNVSAIRLYKSHGFVQIGRIVGYYASGRDALKMRTAF